MVIRAGYPTLKLRCTSAGILVPANEIISRTFRTALVWEAQAVYFHSARWWPCWAVFQNPDDYRWTRYALWSWMSVEHRERRIKKYSRWLGRSDMDDISAMSIDEEEFLNSQHRARDLSLGDYKRWPSLKRSPRQNISRLDQSKKSVFPEYLCGKNVPDSAITDMTLLKCEVGLRVYLLTSRWTTHILKETPTSCESVGQAMLRVTLDLHVQNRFKTRVRM